VLWIGTARAWYLLQKPKPYSAYDAYYRAHTVMAMNFLEFVAETFSKPSSAELSYSKVLDQVRRFTSSLFATFECNSIGHK
jgi:hypothetical protein